MLEGAFFCHLHVTNSFGQGTDLQLLPHRCQVLPLLTLHTQEFRADPVISSINYSVYIIITKCGYPSKQMVSVSFAAAPCSTKQLMYLMKISPKWKKTIFPWVGFQTPQGTGAYSSAINTRGGSVGGLLKVLFIALVRLKPWIQGKQRRGELTNEPQKDFFYCFWANSSSLTSINCTFLLNEGSKTKRFHLSFSLSEDFQDRLLFCVSRTHKKPTDQAKSL